MKQLIKKILKEEFENKKLRFGKNITEKFLDRKIEKLSGEGEPLKLGFDGKKVIEFTNYDNNRLSINYHFIKGIIKMLNIGDLMSSEDFFSIIINWVNDNFDTTVGPDDWEWNLDF